MPPGMTAKAYQRQCKDSKVEKQTCTREFARALRETHRGLFCIEAAALLRGTEQGRQFLWNKTAVTVDPGSVPVTACVTLPCRGHTAKLPPGRARGDFVSCFHVAHQWQETGAKSLRCSVPGLLAITSTN